MKLAMESKIVFIITILSLIFIGISFADFYTIITTGSAINRFTGEFVQSSKAANNSYLSVVFMIVSCICIYFKKKWTNLFALFILIINLLTIVFVYPLVVSLKSMIGASYYANLTWIGWIGMIIVLLITLLLIINIIYKRKVYISERKGGKKK